MSRQQLRLTQHIDTTLQFNVMLLDVSESKKKWHERHKTVRV